MAFAAALLAGMFFRGVDVMAQDVARDSMAGKLDSLVTVQSAKLVRVAGPAAVTFDARTKTATVRLFNPSPDTTVVTLSLRFGPLHLQKPMLADALLQEDSTATDSVTRDSLRTDSLGKLWSLESWIQEPLPTQLWLAPHQTVALTFHLVPPATVAPGEYSAHLVVKTMHLQDVTDIFKMMLGSATIMGASLKSAEGRAYMILSLPDTFMPPVTVKLRYPAGQTVQ